MERYSGRPGARRPRPTFKLSAREYELAVRDIVRDSEWEVDEIDVRHLDAIDGAVGRFVIDVSVRFRLNGLDYLTLFECKRHASPVEREDVLVLHAKMQNIGASKGVMVAANGYQSGALEYAAQYRIACINLVDDSFTYELRDALPEYPPTPSGQYAAFWWYPTKGGGLGNTRLSGIPDYTRHALSDNATHEDTDSDTE